jgi:protein-tyrosine phosphatase
MINNHISKKTLTRLPLKGIANCRELGGYATVDGKVTRWHNLLRSNTFTNATEADLQFLLDYGVNNIIDLRTALEIEKNPNPANNHKDFAYKNVDLNKQDEDGLLIFQVKNGDLDEYSLGRKYMNMVKTNQEFKQVFDILLENLGTGGVLFHCTAGKDRTGVVAMLLLGLAGVSKVDIIANYQVSHTYIEEQLNELSENDVDEVVVRNLKHLGASNPANIILGYNTVIETFGSFKGYFEQLGYSNDEIKELKNLIVE